MRATEPPADHSIPSRGDALRYEASIGLYVAAFCAGFCISGVQKSVIALATIYYPTPIQSTGIGWALGIGRFGGPLLIGVLLSYHLTA
ncbi:MAG: transporter, family, 4-hydroxybenzoate transporter [Bradyrhizobium sp.]